MNPAPPSPRIAAEAPASFHKQPVWPLVIAVAALLLHPVAAVVVAYGWPSWPPWLLAAWLVLPALAAVVALAAAVWQLAQPAPAAGRGRGWLAVGLAVVAVLLAAGSLVALAGLAARATTGESYAPQSEPLPAPEEAIR